jgi:hypothetical protein
MKTESAFAAALVLLGGLAASPASAQRGMGEATGVARQDVRPETASLSGKVLVVEIGPCETTTGRAGIGTHFLLKTPKGKELNVHLGPADALDDVVGQLSIGKKVTVEAFRTTRMPKNHFVAQSLVVDGTSIQLRDANLRPFWAGGGSTLRGRGGPQWAPGKGGAFGRGSGRGYGRRHRGGYGRGRVQTRQARLVDTPGASD